MDIAANFQIFLPLSLAAGVLVIWWGTAVPWVALWAVVASLVVGQLGRVELFGQSGGLLMSDLAVALVLILAALTIFRKKQQHPTGYAAFLWLPFLLWSLFVLVARFPELELSHVIVAAAYWVRLAAYILALPALVVVMHSAGIKKAENIWWGAVGVLILLGYVQVFLFPDLWSIPGLVTQGWDPHSGRLVGTWLDPNFFGGFLGLITLYLAVYALDVEKKKIPLVGGALLLSVMALVLTQSRSSFVALAGAISGGLLAILPILGMRKDGPVRVMYVLVITLFLLGCGVVFGILLQERSLHLLTSDPTVEVRITSAKNVWQLLASPNTYFGEGYNAYQFAALRENVIGSFALHSRAGSDSSLLTLWVDTGIVGVVLFLAPLCAMALLGMRLLVKHKKVLYVFPLLALVFLLVHSLFVNSLLYGHILLTMWVLCILVFKDKKLWSLKS